MIIWLIKHVREDLGGKNLLFGKSSKGGWGVMSESKLFEELFVVVCAWKFFDAGGGSHLNPNFLRNFSA